MSGTHGFPIRRGGRRTECDRASRPPRRPALRGWMVEALEGRALRSTYSVVALGDSGEGALRWAINQADQDPGNDTITFGPGLAGQTITLTSGPLEIRKPSGTLTIQGPGAGQLAISGGGHSQVFSIDPVSNVTISGLTITGGVAANGGGIQNNGTLTLSDCTVQGNSAFGGSGGGIANTGSLSVLASTISGNSTQLAPGGGLANTGTATISQSTVSGNTTSSAAGGGIANAGTMTIVDSTLSGNTALGSAGGGISNTAGLTLADDTISGNTASGSGGGISNAAGSGATLRLSNTIVAGDTSTSDSRTADLADTGDLGNTDLTGSNDLVGAGDLGSLQQTITGVDPGLGPLQDNGGPTWTEALLPGSPAIGAGNTALVPAGVTTDQRGGTYARIVNGRVDIGAFEVQGPPVVATGLEVTVQPSGSVTAGSPFTLTVTAVEGSGAVDTAFSGTVTVAMANDPGGATLSGPCSVTAQGGVATFTGLSVNKAGLGYTLTVSGSGLAVTTGAFNVQTVVDAVAVGWGNQTVALQTAADGLRLLPAGRNTDLPWLGIRSVPITLGQAESLTAADVALTSASGTNYGPVTISGAGTNYTITLARPIEKADRLTITISSPLIAPFTRRLDVLPGDFNDDGVVNQSDILGVLDEWQRRDGAQPTIYGDINGDGVVNIQDVILVTQRFGTKLPPLG